MRTNLLNSLASFQVRNKIHCSQETADLLKAKEHDQWVVRREEQVDVKGKGKLQTFFLYLGGESRGSPTSSTDQTHDLSSGVGCIESKTERLIEWNVEVLCGLLRSVIARREAMNKHGKKWESIGKAPSSNGMVLDEVKEIITLPEYQRSAIKKNVDPDSIVLDQGVVKQLTALVRKIAGTYRSNSFHNFGK